MKSTYEWDWPGAEREFKRAIELNPNYATTYNFYRNYPIAMGRPDEALALAKRAVDLEPLSPIIGSVFAQTFHFARQYDRAIKEAREVIDREENFPQAHLALGWAYEQKGMLKEAIEEFQKASTLSGGEPTMAGALGHAYAVSGRREQARKVIEELKEASKRRYVASFNFAVIHLGLGDKDQAFAWLEKAFEDHSHWLIFLKVDPRFDGIRGDSRYLDLRRRMGLPP